jgi:hypothetical protein
VNPDFAGRRIEFTMGGAFLVDRDADHGAAPSLDFNPPPGSAVPPDLLSGTGTFGLTYF